MSKRMTKALSAWLDAQVARAVDGRVQVSFADTLHGPSMVPDFVEGREDLAARYVSEKLGVEHRYYPEWQVIAPAEED